MKSDQNEIKKATKEASQDAYKTAGKQFKEAMKKVAKSGGLPKNMLGFSDQMVESIYSQAYRLYNTGKYTDAIELFRLLVMMNATEAKYLLGLAACCHMLKDYASAVQTYTICSTMDPDSPIPFYHSSDCFIQMGDKLSALVALEMAIKRAGEKPEYQVLKDRAKLTIESIEKERNEKTEAVKKKKK